MTDPYASLADTASSPAEISTPVVPNDSTELNPIPKAILVGTAGVVVGQLLGDTADRTFKLAAGYHPLRFRLIKATGTTAADMVALA